MLPGARTDRWLRIGGALVLLAATACASAPARTSESPGALLVLTPFDGIPIRSQDVLAPAESPTDFESARASALLAQRSELVLRLRGRGLDPVEGDLPQLTETRPTLEQIAALGRTAHADTVLFTELVAYGDIRRSWLWILAAQGLVAGIGHGVVVAAATGHATYGWWAGAAEFALETTTWVGGAVIGSRGIDPVLVRARLVRARDAMVIGRWTREATRPVRKWFRRKGQPTRDERLRAVASRVFDELADRIGRKLGAVAPAPSAAAPEPAPAAPAPPA